MLLKKNKNQYVFKPKLEIINDEYVFQVFIPEKFVYMDFFNNLNYKYKGKLNYNKDHNSFIIKFFFIDIELENVEVFIDQEIGDNLNLFKFLNQNLFSCNFYHEGVTGLKVLKKLDIFIEPNKNLIKRFLLI